VRADLAAEDLVHSNHSDGGEESSAKRGIDLLDGVDGNGEVIATYRRG
jgi:hypothetical protein